MIIQYIFGFVVIIHHELTQLRMIVSEVYIRSSLTALRIHMLVAYFGFILGDSKIFIACFHSLAGLYYIITCDWRLLEEQNIYLSDYFLGRLLKLAAQEAKKKKIGSDIQISFMENRFSGVMVKEKETHGQNAGASLDLTERVENHDTHAMGSERVHGNAMAIKEMSSMSANDNLIHAPADEDISERVGEMEEGCMEDSNMSNCIHVSDNLFMEMKRQLMILRPRVPATIKWVWCIDILLILVVNFSRKMLGGLIWFSPVDAVLNRMMDYLVAWYIASQEEQMKITTGSGWMSGEKRTTSTAYY
ncbi:hypothetical protein ACJX0J_021716 [Zea mays]